MIVGSVVNGVKHADLFYFIEITTTSAWNRK